VTDHREDAVFFADLFDCPGNNDICLFWCEIDRAIDRDLVMTERAVPYSFAGGQIKIKAAVPNILKPSALRLI
jgi:hypothetical protein